MDSLFAWAFGARSGVVAAKAGMERASANLGDAAWRDPKMMACAWMTLTFPGHAVLGCSADGGSQAWCPGPDSNGHDVLASADFKSAVSTDFTTRAVAASVRWARGCDVCDESTQHSCEAKQNAGII